MLLINPELLTEAVLLKLCEDHCPESDSLDFKRELPGTDNADKQELLKDVCSLANTNGGDLVYGVREKAGSADALTPITDELPDAAQRRLLQILDAGLDPRVQGIRISWVTVSGGYILIIRVPASYDGPHSVRINNNLRRFVMRIGTSTSDLTFDQLRAAFDRTATLAQQAKRFVEDRVEQIAPRRTPKPIQPGPISVVHLTPIAGIAGRHAVDLRAVRGGGYMPFVHDWAAASCTFDFDGLIVHPAPQKDGYRGYVHIFRTGAIEAAALAGGKIRVRPEAPERAIVWSTSLTNFYHSKVKLLIDAAKGWGFVGPALLSLALLDAEGYALGLSAFQEYSSTLQGRKHLRLPDVWIDNLDVAQIDELVQPLMDVLWQAFGEARCLDFDADTGKYNPRR